VQVFCREIYHKGPGMVFKGNPNKYVTEIVISFEVREGGNGFEARDHSEA